MSCAAASSIAAGGDFVDSEEWDATTSSQQPVYYTHEDFGFDPGVGGTITLWVEALRPSVTLGDRAVTLQAVYNEQHTDAQGNTATLLPYSYVESKLIPMTVLDIDLDIDSDNDNGFGLPSRNDYEDMLEDNPTLPGKFIAVNDDDSDGDGLIDWADFASRCSQSALQRNSAHPSFARANSRAFSSASPSLSACLPPAWARLGRPPPPPPATADVSRTQSPAFSPRAITSSLTAATNITFSALAEASMAAKLPAFALMASHAARSCSSVVSATSPTTSFAPPSVSADSRRRMAAADGSSEPPPVASFFLSERTSSRRASMCAGASSAGAESDWPMLLRSASRR